MIRYQARTESISIQAGRKQEVELRPSKKAIPAGDPTAPAFGDRGKASQIPGCEPALFIDGIRYHDRLKLEATGVIDSWEMISPLIIDAIEIYKGGGAPPNFNDNCGTVLIWTKRDG